MIVSSVVLAGVLVGSVGLVLASQDRAVRWTALCLVIWPAGAVAATFLLLLVMAMFVRDWK